MCLLKFLWRVSLNYLPQPYYISSSSSGSSTSSSLRELTTHSIFLPSVSKGTGVGRGMEAELSEGVSEGVPEGVSEGVSETCVQLGVFIFFGG